MDFLRINIFGLFYDILSNEAIITPAYFNLKYSLEVLAYNFTISAINLKSTYLTNLWYISYIHVDSVLLFSLINDSLEKFSTYVDFLRTYFIYSTPLVMNNLELVLLFSHVADHHAANSILSYLISEEFSFMYSSIQTGFFKILYVLSFVLVFLYVNFFIFKLVRASGRAESYYDANVATANYLVESEKEIASLDDIFLPAVLLVLIYSWFFGSMFYTIVFLSNEACLVYFGFPFLLLVVLTMPANILYDYGLMFVAFLRGAGSTSILLLELMYDSLATMIMFVRLLVQNIRFLLMFAAYVEMFELIGHFGVLKPEFISDEPFVFENVFTYTEPVGFLFNVVEQFGSFFMKYMYQLGHLLFTVLSHFFAYLALVFWLFSFLYTCFIDERFENYLADKRKKNQKLNK